MIGVGHIGANGLKCSARREQTLHFCKDYFMIYDFVKANHLEEAIGLLDE